ncbi:MAG: hypothetical protein AAFZ65_14235 [Planctomycetota bacterium]
MALDPTEGCLSVLSDLLFGELVGWPFRMVGKGVAKVLTLGRYPRSDASNSFYTVLGFAVVALAIAAYLAW